MEAIKYSRQREAILSDLKSRKDHPTADMLYHSLRKQYPHISLGTVYRNLSLLESIGQIQRIPAGDGSEHYDYDTSPHEHFICNHCGKVIDLHIDDDIDLKSKVCDSNVAQVASCQLIFRGICSDCFDKDN